MQGAAFQAERQALRRRERSDERELAPCRENSTRKVIGLLVQPFERPKLSQVSDPLRLEVGEGLVEAAQLFGALSPSSRLEACALHVEETAIESGLTT